jgi:predicted nucleic acid-binding Zn ribbon protein
MVATWKTEDQGEVACDQCGARYRKSVMRFPMRDKDHFDCNDCGNRMDEWNGTTCPSYDYLGPKKESPAG